MTLSTRSTVDASRLETQAGLLAIALARAPIDVEDVLRFGVDRRRLLDTGRCLLVAAGKDRLRQLGVRVPVATVRGWLR